MDAHFNLFIVELTYLRILKLSLEIKFQKKNSLGKMLSSDYSILFYLMRLNYNYRNGSLLSRYRAEFLQEPCCLNN